MLIPVENNKTVNAGQLPNAPWYRRYVVVYASRCHPLADNIFRGPSQDINTLCSPKLNISHALLQFLEFLLKVCVLLGHLLVFGLPFIACLFQGLNFAFEVARLDIGLTQPVHPPLANL